jgi:hypothetical protein
MLCLTMLPQTRTLNGKSSMLLCEHNPIMGSLEQALAPLGGGTLNLEGTGGALLRLL